MSAKAPHPLAFFPEFIRSIGMVGAICPSSPQLAQLIVKEANVRNAQTIVELGPGDGIFTRHIMAAKPAGARFIALEKNEVFAQMLKKHSPNMPVIEGCATELADHVREHGLGPVQSIVSGLPWAVFPADLQNSILKQVAASLCSTGVFATFAYFGPHWLPKGRAFRQRLQELFSDVRTSRIELRNLPPAFVYIVRK
ncbi:MAG: rRNA adenine N-6-methyltransferase family protein [Chthoniobacterales bacterium]